MIQETPQLDNFKRQLRDSLQRETVNSRAVRIARHANVYNSGDQDEMVYFIETGQIKLLMSRWERCTCWRSCAVSPSPVITFGVIFSVHVLHVFGPAASHY